MLARVVLVAGLALVSAAPASAAPAWLAPVDLSAAGQYADAPQVAVDPAGNAIAVWRRYNGTHYIVQAAARAAGGSWSAPVDLSAPGQNAFTPQVAVDAAGNAITIWYRPNGANNIVQAAVRAAGGSWQAPVDLSAVGEHAFDPRVTVDPAGNAIAVWRRSNGTHSIVQAAVRTAGGLWQTPADLSAAGQNAFDPRVAVDAAGNAIAVWQRFSGTHEIVQAAARATGGSWSAPVDLSEAGQHAGEPRVAVGATGNAIAVWRRYDGTNEIVQAAARTAGGSWQAPVNLSAPGEHALNPEVAVDAAGNAITVWQRFDGTNEIVQAATRPAGGGWLAPVDLSNAGGDATDPRVAIDAAGNAIAVWSRSVGTEYFVQAAARAAGSAWQTPVDLSASAQDAGDPQVAVDPAGNAVAAWYRSNGTHDIAQAAGYDAVGPRLDGLAVPASGTAGQALSFAVSPFDVWSALGTTSWTFGDTQTATGAAVTHTYAGAGTYTVGVSAADALGNATSTTRTITIGAAPPGPPVVVPPTTPQITKLRLSPRSFRAAASGPAVKAAAVKTGTRVSYTLNVAARVRFTVQRAVRGRRAGRRCVKTTRKNRGARRCTRHVTVRGRFARTRAAGEDRFTFTGRLRGRALKPGRYRLAATPARGRPARAAFRIVR